MKSRGGKSPFVVLEPKNEEQITESGRIVEDLPD